VFKSGLGGKITLKLDDAEQGVLSQLFEQMAELLNDSEIETSSDPLAKMLNMSGSTQISDDPALARLFPDGYSDDEHASADFRRFTGKSTVSSQQAQDWLKALNDLRLVLGTRLEISDEVETDFDLDEPGIHLYNYLTYLQGTLIDSLT
jgi:hypothetical protein